MFLFQALLDTDSSRAIWLLFLDTNTSLEQFFTDINIPFDCPTLPLQTYRFGNWTAGGGLTWPSQGFYTRRKNVNGLTIQATRQSVRWIVYCA